MSPLLQLTHLSDLHNGEARKAFENEIAPTFLKNQRWFGGKGRVILSVTIENKSTAFLTLEAEGLHALWLILKVEYTEGHWDRYQVPIAFASPDSQINPVEILAPMVLAGTKGWLVDAMVLPLFTQTLVNRMALGLKDETFESEVTLAFSQAWQQKTLRVLPLHVDQSNTAVLLGDTYFFKLYRRLEAGISPEAELVRYLGETAHFAATPAWQGELRTCTSDSASMALALITDQVASPVNAWNYLQSELQTLDRHFQVNSQQLADKAAHASLALVTTMGRRTAEMHTALAAGLSPEFIPVAFASGEAALLAGSIEKELDQSLHELRSRLATLSFQARRLAEHVLDQSEALRLPLRRLAAAVPGDLGLKMRTHGDYHLGQVLVHAQGVAILDFEGEPTRSLAERRAKQSPLRDVAGMLRSLHYASVAARLLPSTTLKSDATSPASLDPDAKVLTAWHGEAHVAFLAAYFASANRGATAWNNEPFGQGHRDLLAAFMVEKAAYELRYEVQNRPDWVGIPLGGLLLLTTSA